MILIFYIEKANTDDLCWAAYLDYTKLVYTWWFQLLKMTTLIEITQVLLILQKK